MFERLLLSNDVQSVLAVAREEKLPTEQQLIDEVKKEIEKLDNQNNEV